MRGIVTCRGWGRAVGGGDWESTVVEDMEL